MFAIATYGYNCSDQLWMIADKRNNPILHLLKAFHTLGIGSADTKCCRPDRSAPGYLDAGSHTSI